MGRYRLVCSLSLDQGQSPHPQSNLAYLLFKAALRQASLSRARVYRRLTTLQPMPFDTTTPEAIAVTKALLKAKMAFWSATEAFEKHFQTELTADEPLDEYAGFYMEIDDVDDEPDQAISELATKILENAEGDEPDPELETS